MSLKTSKYKFYNRVSESFDNNPLIKEGGNRVRGFYRKSFFNRPLITIVTEVLNDDKNQLIENRFKFFIEFGTVFVYLCLIALKVTLFLKCVILLAKQRL